MQQEQTTINFDVLNGHEYMLLTTFRKSGDPVPTPVWFAREDDTLYVVTQADSGKVKRIRHTTAITIEPCTVRGDSLGPAVEAQARILPPAEFDHANRVLNKKYGLKKRAFEMMMMFNRRSGERTYLAITPA